MMDVSASTIVELQIGFDLETPQLIPAEKALQIITPKRIP